MKLSADPTEDKARKAAAALALLGLIGLGRSQFDPSSWAIGKRGDDGAGGGGEIYLEPIKNMPPGGSWIPVQIFRKQILLHGVAQGAHTTTTKWAGIMGGANTWNNVYSQYGEVFSTPGTLRLLKVQLTQAPGAGKNWVVTIRRNNVNTALAVTITGAATTYGENLATDLVIAAGDHIGVEVNPGGTPAGAFIRLSLEFVSDNPSETVIGGNFSTQNSLAPPRYVVVRNAFLTGGDITENLRQQIMPCDGTFKNLWQKCINPAQNPGGGAKGFRLTLRVNGAWSALTTTMSGAATSSSDQVHEVTVSKGDLVCLMSESLNTPATNVLIGHGMTFIPDTGGESLILSNVIFDNLSASGTEYNVIGVGAYQTTWTVLVNEGQRQQRADICTLRNFIVRLNGSPGAGKSYRFTVRRNGADTALTLLIADAAVEAEDMTHEVVCADGDLITIECTPSGTPTARRAMYSLVNFSAAE